MLLVVVRWLFTPMYSSWGRGSLKDAWFPFIFLQLDDIYWPCEAYLLSFPAQQSLGLEHFLLSE